MQKDNRLSGFAPIPIIKISSSGQIRQMPNLLYTFSPHAAESQTGATSIEMMAGNTTMNNSQTHSYLNLLGQLEAVGKQISHAKQQLERKKGHIMDPYHNPRSIEELTKLSYSKSTQILDLIKQKKQLQSITRRNQYLIAANQKQKAQPNPTLDSIRYLQSAHSTLKSQVHDVSRNVHEMESQLLSAQAYYRFMIGETVRNKQKEGKLNQYGMVPREILEADYQNTLEELKVVGNLHRSTFDSYSEIIAKLNKQISQKRRKIAYNQQRLKELNAGIFSRYINRNIKRPTRPLTNRTQRSAKFRLSNDSRRSQLATPLRAPVAHHQDLFEVFTGNDRVKYLSKLRSDRKLHTQNPNRTATSLRILYSPQKKHFTFQLFYDSEQFGQIPGVIHAALDIYEPLPDTVYTVHLNTVVSISVFSEGHIKAILFKFKNGTQRLVGDSKTKADSHEFSLEGRMIKYIVSYWYAGEFSAMKFIYTKGKYSRIHTQREHSSGQFSQALIVNEYFQQ